MPTEEEAKQIIRNYEAGQGQLLTHEEMQLIRVWEEFKAAEKAKRDEETRKKLDEFEAWVASLDDLDEQQGMMALKMTGVMIVFYAWIYIEITYGPFLFRMFT